MAAAKVSAPDDDPQFPCPYTVYMQVGFDYLHKEQYEKALKSFWEVREQSALQIY